MEVNEALLQISAIRHQMARSEQFRGYRAGSIALTGLFAFVGGAVQATRFPNPSEYLAGYLLLWGTIAIVSSAICIADVWLRYRTARGLLQRETTHLALEQLCPCLIAGGLLTIVIAKFTPSSAWLLPGLWSILFGLGMFASHRLLPRPIFAVATYFLVGGLLAIIAESEQQTFSPWTMPLLFGVGQLLSAGILAVSNRREVNIVR